jgi:hypothetical protein
VYMSVGRKTASHRYFRVNGCSLGHSADPIEIPVAKYQCKQYKPVTTHRTL